MKNKSRKEHLLRVDPRLVHFLRAGRVLAETFKLPDRTLHQELLLIWVTEGHFDFEENGKVETLQKGEARFFPQGMRHRGLSSTRASIYFLHFAKGRGTGPRCLEIPKRAAIHQSGLLERKWAELVALSKSTDLEKKWKSFAVLIWILAHIAECRDSNDLGSKAPYHGLLVWKITQFIDRQFATRFRIDRLLERFEISPSRGNRTFRKIHGVSIQEYLILKRMEKAKELIEKTGESVKKVAQQVGYEDPFYFSRLFKKKYGLSPRDFRQIIWRKDGRNIAAKLSYGVDLN